MKDIWRCADFASAELESTVLFTSGLLTKGFNMVTPSAEFPILHAPDKVPKVRMINNFSKANATDAYVKVNTKVVGEGYRHSTSAVKATCITASEWLKD
jgi:hypothetical protein